MWCGVRWWSFHRPQWRIIGLWDGTPNCIDIEPLETSHLAIADAGAALAKRII
jgi:hypothetical protein